MAADGQRYQLGRWQGGLQEGAYFGRRYQIVGALNKQARNLTPAHIGAVVGKENDAGKALGNGWIDSAQAV